MSTSFTPPSTGPVRCRTNPNDEDRPGIEKWLENFFALTTYEISIPVLRDETLAPPGKTGLIISSLFDYRLTKTIEEQGWYKEFTRLGRDVHHPDIMQLDLPGDQEHILHQFSSTPLTIASIAGTSDGAITGWAFTNQPMPAESRIPRILNAIRTPLPAFFRPASGPTAHPAFRSRS